MNNLKVFAVGLFVVFIGLFVFKNIKDKDAPQQEVAETGTAKEKQEQPEKVVVAEKQKIKKMKDFKGQELLEAAGMKWKTIPKRGEKKVVASGPYGKFPVFEGRHVAEFFNGKLHAPDNAPAKLLFSPEPIHPEIDAKVFKKFKGYGYNQDKKMKVERGKSFFIMIQDEAVMVEEYFISYNWKGNPEKDRYLIRSSNGQIYRKVKTPVIATK
jgi:hypothetical protein